MFIEIFVYRKYQRYKEIVPIISISKETSYFVNKLNKKVIEGLKYEVEAISYLDNDVCYKVLFLKQLGKLCLRI